MRDRLALAARLLLPAVWLGLIIAIDLIEAPLKFQAPGITIPLGLGIGRLVFAAMNVVEVAIAVLLVLALLRPRPARSVVMTAGAIGVLLLAKLAVVRPLLMARTDAVLAGADGGGSFAHIAYIGVDALLFLALAWFLVLQVRQFDLVPRVASGDGAPARTGASTTTR